MTYAERAAGAQNAMARISHKSHTNLKKKEKTPSQMTHAERAAKPSALQAKRHGATQFSKILFLEVLYTLNLLGH
jgi:hypothetical protein